MLPGIHPVILAGGRGTRFWPLSRKGRPKPFLSPDGGPTLLERAWRRSTALAPDTRIFVATTEQLKEAVLDSLPELPPENLLTEPAPRETGPAAVHAAWQVERRFPGAILALLPADHVVGHEDRFVESMQTARRVAVEESALVCLGVPPSGPSSAFGYVVCDGRAPLHAERARVARFEEKPIVSRAEALLSGGRCLWNAGIFVWGAARFLDETARVCPEFAGPLEVLRRDENVSGFFQACPPLSVDRAVMERTAHAWVVGADMAWDDLGGWDALARHLTPDVDGNVGTGERVAVDAGGCLVHSKDKPVVLLGVTDLIVVECEDVILVAHRREAQRLREIPELLSARGLEDRT